MFAALIAHAVCPVLLLTATLTCSPQDAEKKAEKAPTHATLEALKALAGDWVQVGPDGKPTETVATSFKVTAAGSVVHETLFPGTPHEMVTVYHMDGDELVLTHYCAMGNQPRMKAAKGSDGKKASFVCTGVSNLKNEQLPHMHSAELTFVDAGHYKARWGTMDNGKETHVAEFDLVRKK
jgi:hypothetical protein